MKWVPIRRTGVCKCTSSVRSKFHTWEVEMTTVSRSQVATARDAGDGTAVGRQVFRRHGGDLYHEHVTTSTTISDHRRRVKMFFWSPAFLSEPGSARYSSAPSITTVQTYEHLNDAAAMPPRLNSAHCDVDRWPPDPFHALAPWSTCANGMKIGSFSKCRIHKFGNRRTNGLVENMPPHRLPLWPLKGTKM